MLNQGQEKAQRDQDEALLMSFYPHESAGAIRLNLRWRGVHQVNEFTFDAAGEVEECQTETEHTGWVILQPHRNFHVRLLLLGGGIPYTGLYCGAKFPLALTGEKKEPVRQQSWYYFWRFVRQPFKEILKGKGSFQEVVRGRNHFGSADLGDG